MRASWLVVLACDLGLCGGCLRIGGTTTDVSPALVRNPPLIFYPRFVFVANSDSNTISGYRITDNGFLEPFATVPVATGVHPGYLAASPFHKFLYVANLGSHTISGYLIDRNTGQLTECPASPFAVSSDDIRGMVASGTGSLYVATLHNGIWEYVRAPGHVEHRFRRMPNTDSGASRTPIPTQAEHRFRAARTP